MVAVAPSAPKHPVPQGTRTPRPAAGGTDFGRLLEKAAEENRPAPEAKPRAPEAEPEAADGPDDQAPAQTGEKKTTDQEPEPEKEPQPAGAESRDAAPTPAAPQPIIPLSAAEVAKAAAPTQVKTEAGSALGGDGKVETLVAALPGSGALSAAGKGVTPPGSGTAPSLPVTGKTEDTHASAEGDKTDLLAADQLPADLKLNLENLQPKIAERAPEKNSSVDLLSFDELMRPDLKTDVSPEPVLDQLQQALNAALLDETSQLVMPQVVRGLATLVSGGISEMRLQLQPDDLGEIEVRVRAGEGVVRAEMMVQNPEVKHLLDQHFDRLRNALHQQGLDLRGFDIGLAADGRFAQPDRSGRGFQPQGGPRRQADAAGPLPEAPVLAPRGALAVDYLA